MARDLNEIIADLPAEERAMVEARARELIAEEMSLQALRKAMHKTQVAVAKRLKVRQDTVSKIETRSDLLISTLRGYVKAIGGDLELVVRFPDRPPVRVNELGSLAPKRERRAQSRRAPAAA